MALPGVTCACYGRLHMVIHAAVWQPDGRLRQLSLGRMDCRRRCGYCHDAVLLFPPGDAAANLACHGVSMALCDGGGHSNASAGHRERAPVEASDGAHL